MNIRNQAIVQNIKDLATIRKTTIKQIEKDLGFGNGMIGKWKSAPKSPPFEKIEMIASYLGVTVDDLTGPIDTQIQHPELWEAAGEKLRIEAKSKKEAAPVSGDGLPEGYAQLTPANRAIVDRLIADLAKSQSNS